MISVTCTAYGSAPMVMMVLTLLLLMMVVMMIVINTTMTVFITNCLFSAVRPSDSDVDDDAWFDECLVLDDREGYQSIFPQHTPARSAKNEEQKKREATTAKERHEDELKLSTGATAVEVGREHKLDQAPVRHGNEHKAKEADINTLAGHTSKSRKNATPKTASAAPETGTKAELARLKQAPSTPKSDEAEAKTAAEDAANTRVAEHSERKQSCSTGVDPIPKKVSDRRGRNETLQADILSAILASKESSASGSSSSKSSSSLDSSSSSS